MVPGVLEGMVVPKEGTVPSDGSAAMGVGDDASTCKARSIRALFLPGASGVGGGSEGAVNYTYEDTSADS